MRRRDPQHHGGRGRGRPCSTGARPRGRAGPLGFPCPRAGGS
jgi:hypothetical protein